MAVNIKGATLQAPAIFQMEACEPLDARMSVTQITDITNPETYGVNGVYCYVFQGLTVYCTEDTCLYMYIGPKEDSGVLSTDVQSSSNWRIISSKQVTSTEEIDAKIAQLRTDLNTTNDTITSTKTELEGEITEALNTANSNLDTKATELQTNLDTKATELQEAIDNKFIPSYTIEQETAETGQLVTYKLYRSVEGSEELSVVGTINVPQTEDSDTTLVSGEVVENPEGQEEGIYLKLVMSDSSEVYVSMDTFSLTADNVIFTSDLTTTHAIGNISLNNGSATIEATGKSIKEVWDMIFVQEVTTGLVTANPSTTLSLTNAGTYEVGEYVTPAYTTTFNAGSYKYGPATGITVSGYFISSPSGNTKNDSSGTFEQISIVDDTDFYLTSTVRYTAGTIPISNIGNEVASQQIQAGSCTAGPTSHITGYRNIFYGAITTDGSDLTSTTIRSLNKTRNAGNISVTPTPGVSKAIVVAIPQDGKNRKVSKVVLPNTMNLDITSTYVKQDTTVNVYGAVYGQNVMAYDIYLCVPAEFKDNEVHTITIS